MICEILLFMLLGIGVGYLLVMFKLLIGLFDFFNLKFVFDMMDGCCVFDLVLLCLIVVIDLLKDI